MSVSGTPSTGTFTLNVAVEDCQTFAAAGVQDGDIVSYSARGTAGWEDGRGTVGSSATTLTRGPINSSNGNAVVDFGSDVIVWIAILAEDLIQSVILSGNTAGTSAPIISPTLAFAGGNNITLSGTSNSISIIGPVTVAQSVQTLGLFAVGNTTGTTSSETRDARTLSFDGAGIVSVGFSAGSIIVSASTAATNPLLSIFAVGNTTSSISSGVIAAGSLSFDGAGIVSIGVSNSSVVISAPSPAASGVIQNEYAIGNTTGATSSTTQTLSSISVSGAGIVSVGYSTTAAGAGALVISASTAASQGSLSLFAVGNTTISSSTSSALPEALSLSGAGIITVGYSSNTVLLSATTAASQGSLSLYAVGNTTISSSTSSILPEALSFSGTGGISVGYSSNTIILSGGAIAQSLYAVGNTTSDASSGLNQAGSLSFDGAGIVSVGIAGSSVVISAPSPAASGTIQNRFADGNSFGQSSSAVGTLSSLRISATGGISAGFSTDASSGVLMLSVVPPVASGVVGNYFASGNTTAISSSSTHTLSNISVSGAGIVSVGVSTTGAGAGILVVSASTAATNPLLSVFAVGNTTTSVSSGVIAAGSLSFDGAGAVSVGISNSSVVISSPATIASGTVQNLFAGSNTTGQSSSTTQTLTQLSFDGAGIVSVGFSAGSIVISASTAATNPLISVFAVGNTTSSVSSGVIAAGSLSFDGAGLVSVGVSNSSVVVSSPVSTAQSAVGNTTISSTIADFPFAQALGVRQLSGSGIISVGYSTVTSSTGAGTTSSTSYTLISGPSTVGSYAVGNTTGATSSIAWFPFVTGNSSNQISGAGIVSVGYSTISASDTNGTTTTRYEIVSATTAASQGSLSLFAVGNTTISSSTSSALPEGLSLSGAGIITVGYSSNTILLSATTAASGIVQNEYAIGNTTAASSSTTQTLSSVSISGAGIVSVGYSTTAAGAGALVISASTAATNPLLSLFAVGNTTTSVSSGLNQAGSLSFDGAGIVSVGISGSSVVISAPSPAASGVVGNYFASGNTTAISSSSTHTLSNISISGAGIVSVGVTTSGAGAGILLVSASTAATNPLLSIFAVGNTTSSVSSGVIAAGSISFDGAGIVSVGVSNSSVVISAPASVGSLSLFAVGNTTVSSSTSSALPEALSLSGAGIVTVGYSSNTILLSATTAASQGSLSLFAVGNTTGASSSTSSVLPEALSFSGSGAVSVGFSSNTIIISGATVAAGAQSLFAVGNTTSSVSSGVAGAGSLSFDGAGIVSVGVSNSSIVISASTAATNPLLSVFAVGNTTSSVSSGVNAAGSLSFDGTGAISVGISNSSIVISSPPVSSLTGVSGITLSTAGSTISIGEQVLSFVEPKAWIGTTTSTWALGTMALQPFTLPTPLTVNQANFFSSRAVVAPAMTLSSSTASRTVTASATWGSTASLVVYSQQDATSFGTFSSTTASFGMSAVLSASYSSSSKTGSQTVTFGWPQGTSAAVTSSMSTTFSTVSASLATQVMHTSSSLFANWLRNDYPFAASFPPGVYLMGIMWSSASGSSTLSTGLATMNAPTWLATNGVLPIGPGTSVIAVPGAAVSNPFPGVGIASSVGSAVPATVAWQSLTSTSGTGGNNPVNYFYMNQG